jgi:hypothetical protein
MSKLPHIVAALLIVPAPGLAQIVLQEPARTPAPSKAGNNKSDLDNLECRKVDVTGSRVKKQQVCLTKQQWWSYEQEDKEKLQEMQIIGFTSH